MTTTAATSSLSASSSAATSTTSSASSTSGANEAQDKFLKLLVAQLNNQDPMNPMDNAQMTSQIAQINTVTGIQKLNDTVSGLTGQFTAMQMSQGANLIGHTAVVEGNNVVLDSTTGKGTGAFDLAGNASTVQVQIFSPGGKQVGTVDLGSLTSGRHDFDWDGSAYKSTGGLTFKVVATNAGTPVSSTTLVKDKVNAVNMDGTTLKLQLDKAGSFAYSALKGLA